MFFSCLLHHTNLFHGKYSAANKSGEWREFRFAIYSEKCPLVARWHNTMHDINNMNNFNTVSISKRINCDSMQINVEKSGLLFLAGLIIAKCMHNVCESLDKWMGNSLSLSRDFRSQSTRFKLFNVQVDGKSIGILTTRLVRIPIHWALSLLAKRIVIFHPNWNGNVN